MKTIRILFLLLVFIFPPTVKDQTENAVNGWLLTGVAASSYNPDSIKTFLESGTQVFSTWGNTKLNGGWYIQSTFDKDFWDRYYPPPDSFYIELRIKNQKGLSELRVAIPAQDSSNANNGYEKKINLNNSDWQRIKIKSRPIFVGRLYIRILAISTDSSYIGVDLEFRKLAGIYPNGDILIYDSFGSVDVPCESVPTEFVLSQNYPNPFNPTTKIDYSIEKAGMVSLKIYDILGRVVADLVNKHQESGSYTVDFNASKLATGVYFYKLESGSFIQTRKMILIK